MRFRFPPGASCLLALVGICATVAAAAEVLPAPIDRCPFNGRFPIEITLRDAGEWPQIERLDLDIDHVRGLTVTAYVDDRQLADLLGAGLDARPIANQARRAWAAQAREELEGREPYHTYTTLTAELQQIHADHPAITQLVSLGQSVQGRDIWAMKISDNAALDEAEPEVKYTATIHGDEPVGMEMCVYLIRLLVNGYGVDPELTAMVDDLEIWICPLHNPDGNANGTRYNAQGYDLNRAFPDPADDPIDDPAGRPTEVQHMMNFQYGRNFVLGANLHTGALVVNYPWDCCYGQYTPDDTMIRNLSLGYSVRNPPMWNSPTFANGVVLGWVWYVVHGGFQDWAYHWRNEIHVTIEQSNTKWPSATQLPALWDNNREAMLWYLAQARMGVEGFVTDAIDGAPIRATIDVTQIGKAVRGEPLEGFYHRMLEPGTYALEFGAFGYDPLTVPGVVVAGGATTRQDAQLARSTWHTVEGRVTDAGNGEPLEAEIRARRRDTGELVRETASGADGAYAFEVPAWEYDVEAEAEGYAPATQRAVVSGHLTLDFALSPPRGDLLVVTDGNSASRLDGELAALGFRVTRETTATTSAASWPDYDALVWSAGANHGPVSSPALRAALEAFVAAGGRLLIEGGEIGYDAAQSPGYPSFAAGVLHIGAWHADNAGDLHLRPQQADHPVATLPNPLPATIDIVYSDYGHMDAVLPLASASAIFGTTSHPNDAGVLVFDEPGRGGQIVYFAFDFNALNPASVATDLLENSIAYLLPSTQAAAGAAAPRLLALTPLGPSPAPRGAVFRLDLPAPGGVSASVHDVSGRRVRELLAGPLAAGGHALAWDGRDAKGRPVAPGVYFLRATAGEAALTRQFVILTPLGE
ncbi:MAG: carboxypeptidase regulatory-like domain-containing protein [Candidatus Eisenbacteria bacterium]|uniref:Carboxypeptidase regulatory-like domain-containing protein n=1 Tax=Eiseniibacteriota bacterium TaxID=2212470 RepID=A0A938BKT1_UNCEI|nr:carboxypeptidase regulatory-like domain-containing protein [Candidatus Eisenbacteria bacterium]